MALPMEDPIPPELALDAEPLSERELDAVDQGEHAPDSVLRWQITDDGAAEWAMRKLADVQSQVAELEARRDGWMAKIAAWFDQATKPLSSRAEFFGAHLESYALRRREEDGIKTVRLPSGSVSTRQPGPRVVVRDEAAFRAWALAHPDSPAVRIKVDLMRTTQAAGEMKRTVRAVKSGEDWRVVLDDGEVVDWAGVEERPPSATASPS